MKRVPTRKEFLTEQTRKVKEVGAARLTEGHEVRDLTAALLKISGDERKSLCPREESKNGLPPSSFSLSFVEKQGEGKEHAINFSESNISEIESPPNVFFVIDPFAKSLGKTAA